MGISPNPRGGTTLPRAKPPRAAALHRLRRADPQEPERGPDHAPGGRRDRQAEALHRLRLGAEDATVAVEGGELLGQLERVGGDAMRGAPQRGLSDLVWE